MGYPLRWIKAGRLYETTSRSIHSRLLLRPSEELSTILRGIIARGVRKYGIDVNYFIAISNHLHILVVPQKARQMKRFMNFVNSNIAKEAGRLHGWREKFWGRRYRLVPITDEPEAQVARLRYLLAHGCKENLVRKPSEWPGASALKALLKGVPVVGHWFNRTEAYRAKRRGEKVGPWDHAEEESFDFRSSTLLGRTLR
ncbi:MAG: transposase [Thermoanaerobaculia bacterium]|nr:transposase [Thermoanaerobaculia bacterium]